MMGDMTDADRPPVRAGRPRRSSAEVLADAAAELFLEQGYAGTTVDDVARRAGVSRGTFFNYFASKADTFWVEADRTLALLPDALRASGPEGDPVRGAAAALVGLARAHGADGVPWALTQAEAMRLGDDVVTSAAPRLVVAAGAVAGHLGSRGWDGDGAGGRVAAAGLVTAAAAAFVEWARRGVARPALEELVAPAVAAVVRAHAH